jgi:uncharacterized lipoprotein YddW (UPF0748 family)
VQGLHRTIREARPRVRFGISPFGIGRPDRRPAGIEGFSQYDRLFADVELWVEQGWCDYLVPQLYWRVDRVAQSFPVLLDYWVGQSRRGRHVWAGLYTSMVGAARDPWPAAEVLQQVELTRRQGGSAGQVHFSMNALMQDRDGIATRLQQGPYAQPALVPASPWIDDRGPPPPRLRAERGRVMLEHTPDPPPFRWAVWQRTGRGWAFAVHPGRVSTLMPDPRCEALVVSAVDRLGNESARARLRLHGR